jgi:[protein-PII] uridylyltransferase
VERLKGEIETLLYENAPDLEIAKVLKREIKTYFGTLEESFATSGGKDFLVKHTRKIDTLLKLIYKVALRSMFADFLPMKNAVPVALAALGSYGREQLCVYSDIDLMIVYREIPGYNTRELIEKILYILWDTGLKLGHRVHTVEELYAVSQTDITIKTALIESRFIDGSHAVWTQTQNALAQIRRDDPKAFIAAKLEEQAHKHRKFPLTMEPNLKEGVGGFRDANLVFWIGKVLYSVNAIKELPDSLIEEREYRPFRIALEFLFRVRSALHLSAGKKEDRLRLEHIPSVAKLLGYQENKQGHMKCARKVTESLKLIRLYSTIWLERLTRDYREISSEIRYVYPRGRDYNSMLKHLCREAKTPFYAHPTLLKALIDAPRPERPNSTLYKTIGAFFYQPSAYAILSTLSYSRLLRYTLSPMKKVVDLPQFDGYHQYAVDVHSLKCIYHLEHIDDPFIETLFKTLDRDEQAMLKLVTFLHDAGKGRKREHHSVGASLFKVFAQKLGMRQSLIGMGERLIQYHTLMSNVAQREDLYNEKVILAFASHFQSRKLLDMIYILTYADLNGVGDGVYSSFTARLLRTLYQNALESLEHTAMLDEAAKRIKKEQRLKRDPLFAALPRSHRKKILQIPSDLLFLRYTPERILAIARNAFETENYTFSVGNEGHLSIEVIRTGSFNIGYFLAKLAAYDVVNMDICKLFDGMKYFRIDFAMQAARDDIPLIEQILHRSFDDTLSWEIPAPVIGANEIEIDCEHAKSYGMMKLHTANQKGLLAYTIGLFDDMGIDIVSAKIHTIKNRVRDMFLIEKNGNFCHNTERIIEKLTANKGEAE